MNRSRRILLVGGLALIAFFGALVAVRVAIPAASSDQSSLLGAARTSFPGLQPAAAEPTLAGLDQLTPAPGSVVQAPGPFDDRFRLEGLTLNADGVHGSALVVSDVSEILEFEALAGFYDAEGRLLGTGRFVHHLDEDLIDPTEEHGPPNQLESFSIPMPADLQGRAVSAAVGVPVLVNE
ncbi:hypothetical protein [Modestobacter altitudinis]|uniref:hypothetical protein n=1 Tax=Modestobacter altitudinis TaxID=2213158 RepID=UPI00110CBF3E|nr:hypothetical protein [Modestobacter altitudinis]